MYIRRCFRFYFPSRYYAHVIYLTRYATSSLYGDLDTFANSLMRDALFDVVQTWFSGTGDLRGNGRYFSMQISDTCATMQARVIDGRDTEICSTKTTRLRDRQPRSDAGGRIDEERRELSVLAVTETGLSRDFQHNIFSPIHPRRLFRKIKRHCFTATNVLRNNVRVPVDVIQDVQKYKK